MSGSIAELVAQLLAVRGKLDAAAVTALRARADAEVALARLVEVQRGSSDNRLRTAVADAEVARDKAGRYARLLADAARHITTYVNTIAPGAAPTEPAGDDASPSGERVVTEAERRGRRADIAWRKQVQKADDTEDSLKNTETSAREVFKFFKQHGDGQGGTTSGTTSPGPTPGQDRPHVDNPVTAAVMAAGALAVTVKAIWNHGKARRARKRDENDQS
ncbi:hypothetical protein GCM10029963_31540 [Micromonospora andamanensis]|uniref:hypothetical protein n=1 Tax=Micromonospora andamanensis TaxID=1287068 RepID=UPI0019519BBF|nr:hypothetical protein [Micromonospora andamanensis]GIJ40418.1 hypothetical protein Vwe01_37430 [Micromonospora andamanensis]